MINEIKRLIREIQSDYERASRTGSELCFYMFWSWVLFAWGMMSFGFPVIVYLVLFGEN